MSSNDAKKNTRWRYYIDRRFQNLFMFRFAAIIILISIVSLIVLFLVRANSFNGNLLPGVDNPVLWEVKSIEQTAPDGSLQEIPVPTGKSWNAFQLYWPPILAVSVVNLLLVTIFGLFYSHSMAGPIHNMKVSLQKMIDGEEVRAIKIRKNDQFQELVSLLNQFIEKRAKK
ncbi:MAG: methyl-accepting chemotaxis protein [Leptospiraceae bacterium]|nr:methyl-accepting chemotaxis protein [Leptospiraceae bacterium]